MQVREIMTENPACCPPETSLQEVALMMVENDCGCIPIIENRKTMKPVGTITDRDIAVRTFAAGQNPLEIKASDIMTSDIITVKPDISVEECCDVMEDGQIRRVLVVDENGSCCGIVAQADVAEYASPQQTAEVIREISEAEASPNSWMITGGKSGQFAPNGESLIKGELFLTFLAGLGSGAALMYFLDPDRGRRRRALVGDQVTSLTNNAQKTIGKKQRDLQNRAKGLWAETRKAVTGSVEAARQQNKQSKNTEIEHTETAH